MKQLSQLLLAGSLSILGLTVSAQTTETTGNLVYTTVNPAPTGAPWHSWTGFQNTTSTGGNTTSANGNVTGYNPTNGTFYFGYNQGTIAYTYAMNQALAHAGSGVQIQGYNWSWDINNNNYDNRQGSVDTLTARIITYAANNSTVRRLDTWTYNTKFDWTTFSGTVNYVNPGAPSEFGNMRIEFEGRDSGFWAGYYGPQVRNIDVRLKYGVDQCVVDPQSSPTCPGYKTYYTDMWDDGYAQVDLPFTFPFYGQQFTRSYMFTNGVVGFLDPYNSFCCSGVDLSSRPGPMWNFAIYGLQTDLGPGHDSRFWSQVGDGGTSMRYGWDRVYDLGTNNASTFDIQIKNTGYIGINYQSVNSQYHVTAGIAGDIEQGQYSQIYNGWGGAFTPNSQYTFTGTEVTDPCAGNPLYSSTCPGYAVAYLEQQCSMNPLFSTQCAGYEQAYFTQQCSMNTLYSVQCPGYATAYYNYQCSQSALYHTGCPGYTQAFYQQQCAASALYDIGCPGYSEAYFNEQCTADPLYDSQCSGYADAYYVQQCTADPLYDSGCTGYAEAYALKFIVVTKPAPVEEPVVKEDRKVEEVLVAEASNVAPPAAAVPAVEAAAPVSLTAKAPEPVAAAPEPKKSESSSSSSSKDQPKSNRQAVAERRLEAVRTQAAQAAKNNSSAMSSQMDSAASMEQQVELQNVVIGAMGFVAGFDVYGKVTVPDAAGYKPFEIYRGQRNIDSPAGRRLLTGSDRAHQDMVDSQYK